MKVTWGTAVQEDHAVVAQGLCATISTIIDCHGAYITHATALVQDAYVRAADKANFKGYAKKMAQS